MDIHGPLGAPRYTTMQKEPWQPVFVFAVSGLGAPASRRLAAIQTIQESTR
jgi:hypothetical protein